MHRKSDEARGFPTDKVEKVTVQGLLTHGDLNYIEGILTEPDLDKDDMAELLTEVKGISLEAGMILVSSWFDAGRNKMDWEKPHLHRWITGVLANKMGKEPNMKNFGVELVKEKMAAIAERIATVMTEEQYLESKGVGMSSLGDFGMHRYPRRPSKTEQTRTKNLVLQNQNEWQEKRDELREEYRQLVLQGEVHAPSRVERLMETAKGMPENSAVQAARRILRNMGLWNDQIEKEVDYARI